MHPELLEILGSGMVRWDISLNDGTTYPIALETLSCPMANRRLLCPQQFKKSLDDHNSSLDFYRCKRKNDSNMPCNNAMFVQTRDGLKADRDVCWSWRSRAKRSGGEEHSNSCFNSLKHDDSCGFALAGNAR
jgi:hypothetical protein